jgi:hypothetical protein
MCEASGVGAATGYGPTIAQDAKRSAVAPVSAGGPLAGISTALQGLVHAVQQLAAVIGGAIGQVHQHGATQAGSGAAQLGTTAPAGHADGHDHAHEPLTSRGPLPTAVKQLLGDHVITPDLPAAVSPSGKRTFQRPVPEDREKASAILQRLIEATKQYEDPQAARAAGYDFNKHALEGDLLHVSKPGNPLDIDDPNMLLYRKTGDSYKLIGVVLGSSRSAPDLGMGTWHVHGATNTDFMKHIWFTPNDLDTAFQEPTPSRAVI